MKPDVPDVNGPTPNRTPAFKGPFKEFSILDRIMVFQAYLDDSADAQQRKVVLYGGFLGRDDQWRELNGQWKNAIKSHGIQYFRSSECRSLTGQFDQFHSPESYPKPTGRRAATKIRDRLKDLINKSEIKGIASGVLVPEYEEVLAMQDAVGGLCKNPADAAFQSVIFECANRVKKLPGHHRVAFICDLSDRKQHEQELYRAFRECNPSLSKVLGGMTHKDDKDSPALQAADLMAHLAHDLLLQRCNDTNPDLKEVNVALVGYWNKEYTLAVLKATRGSRRS